MNEYQHSDNLNEHEVHTRIVLDVTQILEELGISMDRYTEDIIQILTRRDHG